MRSEPASSKAFRIRRFKVSVDLEDGEGVAPSSSCSQHGCVKFHPWINRFINKPGLHRSRGTNPHWRSHTIHGCRSEPKLKVQDLEPDFWNGSSTQLSNQCLNRCFCFQLSKSKQFPTKDCQSQTLFFFWALVVSVKFHIQAVNRIWFGVLQIGCPSLHRRCSPSQNKIQLWQILNSSGDFPPQSLQIPASSAILRVFRLQSLGKFHQISLTFFFKIVGSSLGNCLGWVGHGEKRDSVWIRWIVIKGLGTFPNAKFCIDVSTVVAALPGRTSNEGWLKPLSATKALTKANTSEPVWWYRLGSLCSASSSRFEGIP